MTREEMTLKTESTKVTSMTTHHEIHPDEAMPATEPVAETDMLDASDVGDGERDVSEDESEREPASPADSVGTAMARELEAAHWKTKAVHAQELVDSLEKTLASMRSRLDETMSELSRSERRQAIDRALVESRTIDLDTSRVLIEQTMTDPGTERRPRDVESAVRDLRRRKPHLFEVSRAKVHASGIMEDQEEVSEAALHRAADDARTGDRGALLRYLRLRRGTTEENGTLSA